MILPTIHINGTPKAQLLESTLEVKDAVETAWALLRSNGPNGRDYYPQGQEATNQAIQEHCARLTALEDVMRDLQAMAEHIAFHP